MKHEGRKMMKKPLLTSFTTVALLLGLFVMPTYAEQNKPVEPAKQIQLTEKQKAELSEIYQDLLEERKELIQKYVEFGAIPKEKGDQMIQKFEEHYKMIEQNGFQFSHHPHAGHHPHWKHSYTY
jgi:predicted TIM-barrel fold metal-dependent hydrolase